MCDIESNSEGNPSSAIDLKDGEEALVEVVKVGALEVVVAEAVAAVEVRAEDLEAEHGEDAHDEEEQQEQRGDRLDAVGQRLEQVGEVAPVPVRDRSVAKGKRPLRGRPGRHDCTLTLDYRRDDHRGGMVLTVTNGALRQETRSSTRRRGACPQWRSVWLHRPQSNADGPTDRRCRPGQRDPGGFWPRRPSRPNPVRSLCGTVHAGAPNYEEGEWDAVAGGNSEYSEYVVTWEIRMEQRGARVQKRRPNRDSKTVEQNRFRRWRWWYTWETRADSRVTRTRKGCIL